MLQPKLLSASVLVHGASLAGLIRNTLRWQSSSAADSGFGSVVREYLKHSEEFLNVSRADTESEFLSEVFRRQIGYIPRGIFAIEKNRCRHGFPRAIVQRAVAEKSRRDVSDKSSTSTPSQRLSKSPTEYTISSGMLRLTCPYLVKAIDELEAQSGVQRVNQLVANTPEYSDYKENFHKANATWQRIREETTSPTHREVAEVQLGPKSARRMFESGLIGITQGRVDDVKCLHAQLADLMLRDGLEESDTSVTSSSSELMNTEETTMITTDDTLPSNGSHIGDIVVHLLKKEDEKKKTREDPLSEDFEAFSTRGCRGIGKYTE